MYSFIPITYFTLPPPLDPRLRNQVVLFDGRGPIFFGAGWREIATAPGIQQTHNKCLLNEEMKTCCTPQMVDIWGRVLGSCGPGQGSLEVRKEKFSPEMMHL